MQKSLFLFTACMLGIGVGLKRCSNFVNTVNMAEHFVQTILEFRNVELKTNNAMQDTLLWLACQFRYEFAKVNI